MNNINLIDSRTKASGENGFQSIHLMPYGSEEETSFENNYNTEERFYDEDIYVGEDINFIFDRNEPLPQANLAAECPQFTEQTVELFPNHYAPLSLIDIDAEFLKLTEETVVLLKHVVTNGTIDCCTDFICKVLQNFFLTHTDGNKEKAYELMTIFYKCLWFINDAVEAIEYNG